MINSILDVKGWDSHVHRECPGSFESTNLSRDNIIREIGSKSGSCRCAIIGVPWCLRRLSHRWDSHVHRESPGHLDRCIYIYIYMHIYNIYIYIYVHDQVTRGFLTCGLSACKPPGLGGYY